MNGVLTGMVMIIIVIAPVRIRKVHQAVPTGLVGAVAGAADRGACGHLVAAAATLMTGTATWASAFPGHRSFWILAFLPFAGMQKAAEETEITGGVNVKHTTPVIVVNDEAVD